jgi:uncharacterized protein YacL
VILILATRVVLALIGGLVALQVGSNADLEHPLSSPWDTVALAALVVAGALVGYLVGGLIGRWLGTRLSALDRAVDRRPAAELLVGAGGLVVGLIAAVLAGFAVLQLPFDVGRYLLLPVVLLVGYVFSRVAARKHGDILRLVGLRSRGARSTPPRILDTSAIIDGRIVDVIGTRFLSGPIVVPQFVLDELQRVADSSDPLKRARGRRGLELIDELRTSANGGFSVRRADYPDTGEVDGKLIRLAQELEGSLVTTDFNLNRVARIQGVEVLNVNELANALKPAVLPGETLTVKVIREGKEYDQGVGYLDDGTMVVVESGRDLVGSRADVEVTSVLQNPSGKMVFARPAGRERGPIESS